MVVWFFCAICRSACDGNNGEAVLRLQEVTTVQVSDTTMLNKEPMPVPKKNWLNKTWAPRVFNEKCLAIKVSEQSDVSNEPKEAATQVLLNG